MLMQTCIIYEKNSLQFVCFDRATLCISAVIAVGRCLSVCLSVCLSHSCIVSKWLKISSTFLPRPDKPILLVFYAHPILPDFRGTISGGGSSVKYTGIGKNRTLLRQYLAWKRYTIAPQSLRNVVCMFSFELPFSRTLSDL